MERTTLQVTVRAPSCIRLVPPHRPPRATLFPYTTLFRSDPRPGQSPSSDRARPRCPPGPPATRSEEHTSELQSQSNLVCRLLLEKKQHPSGASHAGMWDVTVAGDLIRGVDDDDVLGRITR